MKSGVASHILAVEFLKSAGIRPKGDVLIDVVIDEEVSDHGTLDTVIRGYTADAFGSLLVTAAAITRSHDPGP